MSVETIGLGYQRSGRRLIGKDRRFVASLSGFIAQKSKVEDLRYSSHSAGRLHASVINGNEFARVARAANVPIDRLQLALSEKLAIDSRPKQIAAQIKSFAFIGSLENQPAYFISCEALEEERALAVEFARQEGGIELTNTTPHVTIGEIRSLKTERFGQIALQYMPDKQLLFEPLLITDIRSDRVY